MNNNRAIIMRVIVALLAFAFIYYIKDVLAPIVISIFLFYILNPLVCLLSNKKGKGLGLNISFAICIAFFITGLVLYLFFKFIIPPLAAEFKHFGQNLPAYIESGKAAIARLKDWYTGYDIPQEIQTVIGASIQNLIDAIMSFVEGLATGLLSVATKFIQVIMIPILTYYLLKDKLAIKDGFVELMPQGQRTKIKRILSKINKVLTSYIKGVGILCVVIGVASIIGLYLLGVKYFLILGLIAGITEAIPFIGPWIGGVPAFVIAFLASPVLGAKVALLYIAIQSLENHLLVPKVLGDQLELHPAAIIISILILGKLLGAWGLFFAAPIVAILRIVYEEIQEG